MRVRLSQGRLVTLFSARNYFESYENDAALLLVAADESGALRVRAKRLAHRMMRPPAARAPADVQIG
eukprot:1959004-Prymnesium_polylepis.1